MLNEALDSGAAIRSSSLKKTFTIFSHIDKTIDKIILCLWENAFCRFVYVTASWVRLLYVNVVVYPHTRVRKYRANEVYVYISISAVLQRSISRDKLLATSYRINRDRRECAKQHKICRLVKEWRVKNVPYVAYHKCKISKTSFFLFEYQGLYFQIEPLNKTKFLFYFIAQRQ